MPQDIDPLVSINHRIVAPGETLPRVQLKNGRQVQTGTVAAMLENIAAFNRGEDRRAELEAAVPTLVAVGLFELFPPVEWLCGDNPGRRFVGECALRLTDTANIGCPSEPAP